MPLGATFDSQSIDVAPGAVPSNQPNSYWFNYADYAIRHDGQPKYDGGFGLFLLTIHQQQ